MTKNRHWRRNSRRGCATGESSTRAKILRPGVWAMVLAYICLGCAGIATHEAIAQAATSKFTALAAFSDDQEFPAASLVEGPDGSFYFLGEAGHARERNAVFRLTRTGKVELVRRFKDEDGRDLSGIVMARDGNLYGTFENDARSTLNATGGVFRLTLSGKLTTLHLFAGGSEGSSPSTGLMQARDGDFYGTTKEGGNPGFGTIFKVTESFSFRPQFAHLFTSSGKLL
jgi:uncharacterized repeat protein (TIGR03803 family)